MEISVRNKYGWELYENNGTQLWFSGYLYGGLTARDILLELEELSCNSKINIGTLSRLILNMSGHFALIAKFSNNSCFLAVDKICSIPIFDVTKGNRYAVSNYAPYLKEMFDMDNSNVSLQSLLEISISTD